MMNRGFAPKGDMSDDNKSLISLCDTCANWEDTEKCSKLEVTKCDDYEELIKEE